MATPTLNSLNSEDKFKYLARMGNGREVTQTSPVEERDSDSESDMPQLVEEEDVSNALAT